MSQDRKNSRPVIIGVGQLVHHIKQTGETKDVVDLIETVIHKAEDDAQVKDLAKKIDTLFLVNSFSMIDEDPVSIISQRIGAKPDNTACTWIGASAPQWFVNQMKDRLVTGQSRLGLICGGESLSSKKEQSKKDGSPSWDNYLPEKKPWMVGDLRDPLTSEEAKYGLHLPIHIYPLFENALRHHEGMSMKEHCSELGDFCSSGSNIAAKNPYSWFRESKTAEEIMDISGGNRFISWPYTKYMCSIMDVDQTAALFVTDEEYAKELGIPREKWIYLLGSGDASDIWHVSERTNFHSSPSVKVAADAAMIEAGLGIDDIQHLDLYSCFPIAPRITRNMLNIQKDDPRSLTVTGGMPNFGGPGNNYALHAICSMIEILRKNPGDVGMVQALSWYISKHSVGIYSSEIGKAGENSVPADYYSDKLDGLQKVSVVEEASGKATVETYVLFHDREGKPVSGVIIGRLNDGSRFLAKTEMSQDDLSSMMRDECIGKRGNVVSKDGFNFFSFS